MSLLSRGNEVVRVFQEVAAVEYDSDGNRVSRPSLIGTTYKARIQPISSTENAVGGFNTESRYRLRLINYPSILGAQSQIEWNGKRYSIEGDAMIYNGSARTARAEYVMTRS